MSSHSLLGQRLVEAGRITRGQLQQALTVRMERGGRLGDALVALGFVSEAVILAEVARQYGVACIHLGTRNVPPVIVELVPESYIRERTLFPFALGPDDRHGRLFVATSQPQNLVELDEVAFMTGMRVQPVLASERDLQAVIERHLGPQSGVYEATR